MNSRRPVRFSSFQTASNSLKALKNRRSANSSSLTARGPGSARLLLLVAMIGLMAFATVTAYMQDPKPTAVPLEEVTAGSSGIKPTLEASEVQTPPDTMEPSVVTASTPSSANYAFVTNATSSLALDVNSNIVDMTAGTTPLHINIVDDTTSAAVNIGFDFYLMGNRYRQFSATSNGVIALSNTGTTATGTTYVASGGTTTTPIISAFAADLGTGTSGKVHYKLIGAAPNRTLVIEFNNMSLLWTSSFTNDGTYQVRLYESTGIIEFVYGTMAIGSTASASDITVGIGFSTNSTTNNLAYVTSSTNTSSTTAAFTDNATYPTGAIANLNSAADGSRRSYRYTPPQTPAPPTGTLTFTSVTPASMTLNWGDAPTEVGYAIYRSTDGGTTYSFFGSAASDAVSFNATGLTPSTNYFWRVIAISEGATSTALQNNQATPAAGNITSNVVTGNWSAPATWSGGVVPTAGDNVTIANGATVTIDVAANAYSVTVGQGTSGILQYETTTARTLTVSTDVTIASGGTFKTGAAAAVTTHVLSIAGNLTNNGTLDFSTTGSSANSCAAGITFTGAANNSFSGTGATTDIRTLTINKGADSSSILEITASSFTVQGVSTDGTPAAFLTLTNGTLKISGTFTANFRTFTPAAYTIGTSAGLWLNNPNYTVTGQNGSPTNNGLVRVSAGTFNVGSSSGNAMGAGAGAVFTFEGGTTNFSGRLNTANAVTYTQTAGIVNVCTVGSATSTTYSFSIPLGTFTMSGGTINLVQINSTATAGNRRDYQVTATPNITGGTLNVGTAATTGNASNFDFRIFGYVPNLVVDNTTNAKNALAFTTSGAGQLALVVFGNTTVNPGASLNANGFLIQQVGNTVTNNGSIVGTVASSRFDFAGSAAQTYGGSGTFGTNATPFGATGVGVANTSNVTLNAPIITTRVNLFTGQFNNSNQISLGGGGSAGVIVQRGGGGGPSGSFDLVPNFNLGTGTYTLVYSTATTPVTTGFEIPATRSVTTTSINNSNGVTLSGGNLTNTGGFLFTLGNLTTGANTLIIPSTGNITHASGHVIGNLQRTFAAAAPIIFDVGTANAYSPVTVNATAGTFPANFTISATQGAAPYVSGANKLARFWTLSGTGITADLTFTYPSTDVTGTAANYQFIKNSGGTLSTLAPAAPPTTTSAAINGVSSFSDWTLAEPSAVLPGSLQLTSATYSDSETNADHTFNVPVTRTGGSNGAVSVTYSVTDGTATTADNDYVISPASGSLNWADGDATSKNIAITVKGDTTFEPDETVNIAISAATNGASLGSPNTAVLTITNDDVAPDITFNTSGSLTAGTYNNITINSPAVVTMTGDVIVNGCVNVNGGTLNMGGFTFTGAGCFTLSSGATLGIGSAAGITTGATGNVQVGGARTFSTGANYVYDGTGDQAVGNALPGTVANLTINNSGTPGTVTGNSGQIVTNLLSVADGVYVSASDYNDVDIAAAGTLSLSGDITVSGNWTNNNGTFTPNGFRVTFDGTGTQTITRPAGETFATVSINKASGTAQFLGAVHINGTTGNVLELLNGTLGLNGGSLNLDNNGGNVLVSGGVRTITAGSTSAVALGGTKTVTATAGGTLVFDTNINVVLSSPVDFGASLSTINGQLIINGIGSVTTNAPTYGAASTLQYTNLGSVSRGTEWTSTTASTFPNPGYPNNVTVDTLTTLQVGRAGGTTTNWAINGTLTAGATGTVTLAGTQPMTVPVTVKGNVNIASGALVLSSAAGGDLNVGGNWANTGTFTPNSRAVNFNGNGNTQTISGTNAFADLTISHSGAGTVTAAGSTLSSTGLLDVISGTFTSATAYNNVQIDVAGTLSLSGAITVSGNWTNNSGTFAANGFGVTFNGGTGQTIGGAGTNAFYDLTKSAATAQTMFFKDGATQNVTNSLTLTGAAGNLLSLRSTTPGAQWKLIAPATQSVSYVDVQDSDASGGVTVAQTNSVDSGNNINWAFAAPCVPPSTVYVDDNFVNPVIGQDPDAGGPATNFGCDSFATIQGGVNGVTAGGTVIVRAGTYPEAVLVNKAVSIQGAQVGQNANTRFAAFAAGPDGPKANPAVESIITAAATAPASGANDTVHVMASNVTIDGFVIDGNNPSLAQGGATVIGGINTDSRRAIQTEDAAANPFAASNTRVQYNVIQNFAQRGVELINGTASNTAPATTGNVITQNRIRNFGVDGVVLAFNAYADVTFNTVDTNDFPTEAGIWVQDFLNTGTPLTNNINNNTVTVGQDNFGGIWVNLAYQATLNINSNTVNARAGVASGSDFTYGIYVTSLRPNSNATLSGNIVGSSGGTFDRGIALWNLGTGQTTTVTGGTVGNSAKDVSLHDSDPNFGLAGSNSAVNLSGVSIDGTGVASDTGIFVDAVGSTGDTVAMEISGNTSVINTTTGISVTGANASANVHNNVASIHDNATGISVDGGSATLTSNNLYANVTGIALGTSGTLTAHFNRIISTTTAIANPSNLTPNLENNWWGCNAGPGNAGCGAVTGTGADFDPRIVLLGSASPNPIAPGGTSTVTADMTHNSDNAVPVGTLPDIADNFTATNGTMNPINDTVVSGTDTSLFTSTNSNSAVATITVDNQPVNVPITVTAPSFSIDDVTHFEGSPSGTTSYVFTVTKTGATAFATSVNFSTVNGSATLADNDYQTNSGTLPFGPTDTTMTITVLVNQDTTIEPDEAFTVHLDTPVSATISDADGTGTITNDDVCGPQAIVYVDAAWVGTTPGTDPDGIGPATNFGCDSFATIQGGINGVATSGQVIVAAGTYVENPSINRAMAIKGAQFGIDARGRVASESIVRTNGNQVAVFSVTAANVTIDGFSIDGDDPLTAGAALFSGDESNVQYGVRPTGAGGNLNVSHNIIKKVFIGLRGDVASQGNVINQNSFDSIGNFDFGYAVSIRNNFYADVTNNKMTRSWTGIHINNHNGPGGPASFNITGNEIHSYAGGILYWLQFNQATSATISNNQITAETGAVANNFGVLMVSVQDALNPTFANNTMTGTDYGIGLTNTSTSNIIEIGATNTISATKIAGVYLTDNLNFNPVGTTALTSDPYVGPANNINVRLNGTSINVASGVGVKVSNSRAGTDVVSTADIIGNTSISGAGSTGLQVVGPMANASMISSKIIGVATGISLQNSSGTPLTATAHFNRIITTTTAIDNPNNQTVNFENNWWGCNAGPGNAGCGAVTGTGADFNPWLVLGVSASPNPIPPGGNSTVTADMTHNSDNAVPVGLFHDLPVAWSATNGTMAPPTGTISAGAASSTFTSTNSSSGTGCATVDNQLTCTNITVVLPSFSIDDVTHNEGNGGPGTTSYTFTITKTGAGAASVDYNTVDGSATSPSDFAAITTTTVSFLSADTTKQFTVFVNGDTAVEPNEAFTAHLSNAVSGTISDADGTGTITNDDACGAFATVYVDDNWVGTPLGSDPDGVGPATSFGCDSFATIQGGATAVTAGGTVIVADGTYTENVSITKAMTLKGNQFGVDARGRAAAESIVIPAAPGTATFAVNVAGLIVIDGFSFSGGTSATQGCIFNSVGPNDGMQIRNNRFSGYSTAAIWLQRSGADITIDKNVMDGSNLDAGGTNQTIFLNAQAFNGINVTNNNIINNTHRYGLFVDGIHNVGESATRAPAITGNLFNNNLQGLNLGSRSFGTNASPVLGAFGGFITNNTFSNHSANGIQAGIQHVLVSGNTFSNNTVDGLALTSFGNAGADRGAQFSMIISNTFTGNGGATAEGLFFTASQAAGTISSNQAHFNRFLGNFKAMTYNGTEAINVENNWFGCNSGPGTAGCDALNGTGAANLDANPWIVLGTSASPNPIPPGGTSTVTADMTHNSDTLAPAGGAVPLIPVSFTATNGTIAPPTGTITAGQATSLFTSTSNSSGTGCATVDNSGPICTNINITLPSFSIDDVTHNEGNGGPGSTSYTFTITKTGSTAFSTNVDYATVNGSATAPTDFTAITTTNVVFSPTDTTKQFTVFVNGDTNFEPTEAFTVHLSNPSNATISDADGTGTITNDDAQPSAITVTPAITPTAADNDYTRINNAVQIIAPNGTITLSGTFNWTEANAAASWALGSNGIGGDLDDYSILVPANLNGVTFTAANLGDATIQGPGDLAGLDLEGVFFFNGGDNQNWTLSNIRYLDFDLAIGMFSGAGGTDAFNNTHITNNYIRMARDVASATDTAQNIAIYYSYGTNQLISGNTIDIQGDAVTVGGNNAADIGMQCDTSGGNVYNGLQITNNTIHVLNAQSANPEVIIGIWENAHAHSSNITLSGNTFTNQGAGNNTATNLQRGFRVTSHSSGSTTVAYQNNTISGANIGFQWIAGSTFGANQPIVVKGNTVTGNGTGVLVQSQGVANLSFNRIVNNTTGLNNIDGTVTAENNWWGCNAGPGNAGCNAVSGTADFNPWIVLGASATPGAIPPFGNSTITADMRFNSDNVNVSGTGTIPSTPVAWSATNGTMAPPTGTVTLGLASSTFTSTSNSSGTGCATVDNQQTCAPVTVFPTTVTIVPATSPTAADNDYTRINNAIQSTFNGQTIKLLGTFNWTEANAAASWALGSNGIGGDLDDYSILVPAGINNVTFTADNLGDATIQGPGDLSGLDLEGVFFFNGGDNQNWTLSNIRYLDFDLAIGMFSGAGGTDAFNNTHITNNYIRMARDVASATDTAQNIAIYYSFGANQVISGNTIDIQGDAVTVGGNNAADIGMQCDTSGGNVYNGLQITNNTIHVLNAQSANPEVIIGIWENAHAHSSNITLSGNTFTNQGAGNNTATNLQRGFRVTSHSSGSTTVAYQNNTISGANIGFQWIAGSTFGANQAIVVKGNTVTGNGTGVLVQSQGVANLSFNRIVNNTTGLNNIDGTVTAENNWWGCNAGPGNAGCNAVTGTADFNPWIVLGVSASPNTILSFASSTVTADMRFNSDNVNVSGTGTIPSTPVTWSATNGTMAPPTGTVTLGLASSNFTSTGGAASACAMVDNQQTCTPITVNKANTTTAITSQSSSATLTQQNFDVFWSVTVDSPGTGTPTGNVQVSDGVNNCAAPVANGSCTIALSTTGSRNLTATYLGDGNFNASPASSPATVHTVSDTAVWTGSTNTGWANDANWTTGLAPQTIHNANIPSSGVTNEPKISTVVQIQGFTLAAGRTLMIGLPGGSLTAATSSTVAGTIVSGPPGPIPNQDFPSFVGDPFVTNSLTVTNAGGISIGVNTTVNGLLSLTAGNLTMTGGTTLSQPALGTSAGTFDVIGNVKRLGFTLGGPALSFGNPLNTIAFANLGTVPTDVTVNLVKAAPSGTYMGNPIGYPNAVQRTYTIEQNGGVGFSSTLQLRYIAPAELNGNTETTLQFWHFLPGFGWQSQSASSVNTGNQTVSQSGITSFSPWTMASHTGPTVGNGSVSGQIVDSNGNPVEGAAVRMNGAQNRLTVTDAEGNYHFEGVATNGVYTVVPSRANFVFSPSQRSFTQQGARTEAAFNGVYNGGTANPLDATEYFVRQQYLDFFGREPDEAGFNFWVNNIEGCGASTDCRSAKRTDTSAAFFLSIEFQQTGYLVYRMYQSAYGDMPGAPVPLRLSEFRPDSQLIGSGVVVNQTGWQEKLEANKRAFAEQFVQRTRFTSAYPTTLSPTEFVNQLFHNAGVTPSESDRAAAIAEFGTAVDTADAEARGRALRQVSENSQLRQQEFNQAFVLMQYFGYLRRDPNSGPDADFAGYTFWLNKLDQFNGNFADAEMVKAFLVAGEYRGRFPK